MNNVKIKKAKIKDNMFLETEYVEMLPNSSKKDAKVSLTIPVHQDMKDAFAKLHVHLAILCDEVKTPSKKDLRTAEYEGFGVRGFSIGGSDEYEGVTISGLKEGTYGIVNLNTPFTKFSSDDYPFTSQLGEDIERCIYEVTEYLFNSKRAPEAQLEIEFEEADLV